MNSEPPIVDVENLRKAYGRRNVLTIGSLKFWRGDAAQLRGANASGKSTLLRILAGVAPPTSGRVVTSKPFGELRSVLLPQTGGLYHDLTVRQNLSILAQLYAREPSAEPFETLFADVEQPLDTPLLTLSGGMQRLASIAALLSIEPDFVFLDEPFAGLDKERRERLAALLSQLAGRVSLLVITEHNIENLTGRWRTIELRSGKLESDE